jgi:ArsR family transcriptional regulator
LAPSTVSFHLKKLAEAGLITSVRDQYYTIYSAVPKVADMSLKDLVLDADVKLMEQDEVEEKYRDKVLKSFFKYGKLVKIPSQKMKREWVLERVAESFQGTRGYSPAEAGDVLSEIFEDPALLLKELKAGGFLKLTDGKFRRASKS